MKSDALKYQQFRKHLADLIAVQVADFINDAIADYLATEIRELVAIEFRAKQKEIIETVRVNLKEVFKEEINVKTQDTQDEYQ